ncbi:MAG: four-carbon acid sugar kinase family protein, partial [Gammaproteobacteria bacterium]|nr:four-carbon acid sugar kinase family protein [Gammaproteobacteria bacterium]
MNSAKIIVIDDDPTGSQTVHSCLLLTRWDKQTIVQALRDDAPLFFILSNTRAFDADRAAAVTRQICVNIRHALKQLRAQGMNIAPIIVSRSDSTLRGHYPVETDVIARELGPFDAHFLVPAFFEGGRITRDATHYLIVEGRPVPVHETEFARDSVFGFSSAFLPDYAEEKTGGRIRASDVRRFDLAKVRGDVRAELRGLSGNTCCVVDAIEQPDLDGFCRQITEITAEGKRFLFRSAASLLTSLAALPPQPTPPERMAVYSRNNNPGAVIVGSYVAKSTRQLTALMALPGISAIEVEVDRIQQDREIHLQQVLHSAATAFDAGLITVIHTSRGERVFGDSTERLAFGEQVSAFLVD